MVRSMKEVHTINYYPINEGAARRAKEMNSFSDYKEGSATAEYRAMVDKAAAIAEQQKSRVDPMYHEKIDHLLDTYARKLAENMNQGFAIDARVPSVMIAGPANFPVGKKEKQNRARDSNMEEWRYIQGLLDKIRSTGMGGISADDPAAIEKLQKKLDGLERSQLIMKEVNAYYDRNETDKHHQNRPPPGLCDGNPHGQLRPYRFRLLQARGNRHRSRQDDESAGSGSCYTKNGDLTDHKEADLTLLPLYRQPPHVVQSRYGIVGLAVGNGGFYVKTDQPTTNYRPLPKTIP